MLLLAQTAGKSKEMEKPQGLKGEPCATCSKLKLEGELDRPRPANLVERVETTIRATGPQAACQCLCGVAEQGAGQVVIGIAEVEWLNLSG